MHEEREQLKKLIDDLQAKCENETSLKTEAEERAEQKTESANKLLKQVKQANDRIYKLEKMVNEYKEGL